MESGRTPRTVRLQLGGFAWADLDSGAIVPLQMTDEMLSSGMPGVSDGAAWFAWEGADSLPGIALSGMVMAPLMQGTLLELEPVPPPGEFVYTTRSAVAATPDGRFIAVSLHKGWIEVRDQAGIGAWRAAPPGWARDGDFDVRGPALSDDGRSLAYLAQERGNTRYHQVYVASRQD
jgi:hypothetical protein